MRKTIKPIDIKSLQAELAGASAEEILSKVAELLDAAVFATSLGQEDQVILDLIARQGLNIPVFTLDTGRLFPETYDLIAATEQKYGLKIQIAFPDAAEVEQMVAEEGINLFRKSIDARKRCCGVRKMHPLKRFLGDFDGWISGLRRDQSPTRTEMHAIEWDSGNAIPKFNPLIDWTLDDVQRHLRGNDIPCNPLHDRGFVSIGCACCTRAIQPGEDIRAGRWWWENPEQKECGLHSRQESQPPEKI
ncbi:MAG: phosphoadenylyl-sulfate reductase [Verrucomicrobia bacterium]|nr:MAG: phosphoadenylyl-sulfate reductase [Verrucomicrobiota bacterium]